MSIAKRVYEHRVWGPLLAFEGVSVFEKDGVLCMDRKGKTGKKSRKRGKKYRSIADVMLAERGPRGIPYSVYLNTSHWQKLRYRVLKLDHSMCVRCKKPGTVVHHRNYERLGCEKLDDLVTVCAVCHHNIHEGKLQIDRIRRGKKRGLSRKQNRRRHRAYQQAVQATAPDRIVYKKISRALRTPLRDGTPLLRAVRVMLNRIKDPDLLRALDLLERKLVLGREGTIRSLLVEAGYRLRAVDLSEIVTRLTDTG